MDRNIESLKKAEPKVREWYRNEIGFEFPEISYSYPPEPFLRDCDKIHYSSVLLSVPNKITTDEWNMGDMRKRFRSAARRVLPKYGKEIKDAEGFEITREYCEVVADDLLEVFIRKSASMPSPEAKKYLAEIPTCSVVIMPGFSIKEDLTKIMVHEFFHIIQGLKKFNRRYPLSHEGPAYYVQSVFKPARGPSKRGTKRLKKLLKNSEDARLNFEESVSGFDAVKEVLDRNGFKPRDILNGHVYRMIDYVTIQNSIEDFIRGFLGMERIYDSLFNKTGK